MSKQEQFLWAVQTMLITNSINCSTREDIDQNQHLISVTGLTPLISLALYASNQIPDELSAFKAAEDFCYVAFDNLNDDNDHYPDWVLRGYH